MNGQGLCSVTFRALPAREVLSLAAAAGLSCIEWGGDVHAPPSLGADALRALGDATRAAGLAVSSYGSYHRLGASDPAELPAVLAAAKALGAPVVRVWAGAKGAAESSAGERAAVHAATRAAAALAAREGLALSFECHPGTLTDDPEETLSLLREGPPEALGTHWQPNQYRDEAWNLACAAALAPRVRAVHVFAWSPGAAGKAVRHGLAEHAPLWRRRFAALPASAPRLLEFLPGDDPALLPREAAALASLSNPR